MKERPILFSGAMVQAILEGRKTQTRRVVKPSMSAPRVAPLRMEPYIDGWTGEQEVDNQGLPCWLGFHPDYPGDAKWFSCPHGKTGDRLWVRETWRTEELESGLDGVRFRADNAFREIENTQAAADAWMDANKTKQWRPSIFMPRWASRITLDIVDVRVERVQNISEADAWAEGFPDPDGANRQYEDRARYWFKNLWDSINAERGYGWGANPWVWALTFKVVQR